MRNYTDSAFDALRAAYQANKWNRVARDIEGPAVTYKPVSLTIAETNVAVIRLIQSRLRWVQWGKEQA